MSADPDGSGLQQAFLRRIKSLARTSPIHELEAGKVMRSGDWAPFDLRALSLAAIDTAIEHMGLEYGAPAELIVAAVAGLARGQAPDRPPAEARRVATAVLEALLNERDRRQAFEVSYADPTDAHGRRVLAFHLLREIEAPDGTVVVRATTEAINLFVGALDLEVEDAQAAAEAVLRSQLARGRLDQAVATAREARIRSIQFAEKVRGVLDATRRDVRQVDWGGEVPRLLEEALTHLAERLEVERQLIRATRATLDVADPSKVARAAELADLLEDCRRRHLNLHERLIVARRVFLDEQQRQVFAPTQFLPLPDPEADLLLAVLPATRADALAPLEAFFRGAAGPRPPAAVRLVSLVSALLQPRREAPAPGLDLVEPELEERPVGVHRFAAEARAAAAEVLRIAEPRRLSALLEEARPHGADVDHLVALLALRWFAPDPLDAALEGDLAAVRLRSSDDGTALDDPGFGGADLLVAPAPAEAEPEEEPFALEPAGV